MAKKKASKRTSGGAEGGEKRKKGSKHKASKGLVVYFMACLIEATVKEVPETADEQRKEAQAIRQYAERLAAQTRRLEGDEASMMGGGEGTPSAGEEGDE